MELKLRFILFLLLVSAFPSVAQQLVRTVPRAFVPGEEITIIVDVSQDSGGGLINTEETVYLYAFTPSAPAEGNAPEPHPPDYFNDSREGLAMSRVGENLYSYTMVPDEFFTSPVENKIEFLLKNDDGSAQTGDLTINLYQFTPNGNIVTAYPEDFDPDENVSIILDAALAYGEGGGEQGQLIDADAVFMWSGANNFAYQPEGQDNFNAPFEPGRLTPVKENLWRIDITPRDYFEVPETVDIFNIKTLFKNGDGSKSGRDVGGADLTITVQQEEIPEEASCQKVTTAPTFPTAEQEVTIFVDINQLGRQDLLNSQETVYLYAFTPSAPIGGNAPAPNDPFFFGDSRNELAMTRVSGNLYSFTMVPNVFFESPVGNEIKFLLKNDAGTLQTEDLSLQLFPSGVLNARFNAPCESLVILESGEEILVAAEASEKVNFSLFLDEILITSTSDSSFFLNIISPTEEGEYTVTLIAEKDGEEVALSFELRVVPSVQLALPAGVRDGINYINDETVVLVLTAPMKEFVHVIGEFNDWQLNNDYLMNQTTDGEKWWLEIKGLEPGREYAFQYFVDGQVKIADPYTDKVLDPFDDQFIEASTYPGLKPYPAGAEGRVAILQTGQEPYIFEVTNFEKPAVEDLVIYELLLRDFIGAHDFNTLKDTLSYLKKLGINAIELMPVMEFSGNNSWGYNPLFMFAVDKYYGPKNTMKKFVDEAHKLGIAVILDIVLNQQDSPSPLVQLYAENNFPTPENIYTNPDSNPNKPGYQAPHAFSVFIDLNHESPYTRNFVDSVNHYWIEEYQVNGFRFDLSKGFTQKNTGSNVGAWGAYDQSRIDILTRMAGKIREYAPDAYIILEHFAAPDEEAVLAENGMLLWNNLNHAYRSATAGEGNGDISRVSYLEQGFETPDWISYMESHDEERLMFNALENGASNGEYDIKNLETALNRMKMGAAFFFTVPGPKMLWQFGELGYDISIRRCNTTEGEEERFEDGCRTDPKPILWEYLEDDNRRELYEVIQHLLPLKQIMKYSTVMILKLI